MRFDDDMFDDMDEGDEILSEEADMENRFYDAKCEMEENLESAIEQFKRIIDDEGENKTEWGYKAIRKLCRHYGQTGNRDEFDRYFAMYLEYLTVPSTSKIEKCAFVMLQWVETFGVDFVCETIEKFIDAMSVSNNFNRIVFKLNIRKAQTMYEQGKFDELKPFVNSLIKQCYLENGKEDPMRSHLLVDIYAIQIQIFEKENDTRQLQRIFGCIDFAERSISNNKVNAIVMFALGKVQMIDGQYVNATINFLTAFKSFNDFGSDAKFDALKYYVLGHMLQQSKVDVFQDEDIKQYKDTEILQKMSALYAAYEGDDIHELKRQIENSRDVFFNDEGIRQYEKVFVECAQRKLVMRYVTCFKRVKFNFLGKMLDLEESDVELLLLKMIFDGELKAKINQFERYLMVSEQQSMATRKYLALTELSKQVLNAIAV